MGYCGVTVPFGSHDEFPMFGGFYVSCGTRHIPLLEHVLWCLGETKWGVGFQAAEEVD
jgi:hypothetical protein